MKKVTNPYYTIEDIMELLGCKRTKATIQVQEWKKEIADMGYYPGVKGRIQKAFVHSKLYPDEPSATVNPKRQAVGA